MAKGQRLVAIIIGLSFGLVIIGGFLNRQRSSSPSVGVFLFAQHPVIAEIWSGFRTELDARTVARGQRVKYVEKNADGQVNQAVAIARFFKANQVSVVFVVGLPAAQALKSAEIQEPVVFGGVPDPTGAGLVQSTRHHGSNFTGTQYLPPCDVIFDVYQQLYPQSQNVAVLHNPGEANSMAVVSKFLAVAKTRGISVRDFGATNVTELEANLRALSTERPTALFLPTDNLIYSSLDRVLSASKEAKIPVFSCTKTAVEKGAAFSVGTDYKIVGALSADIADRILFDKRKPEEIDVLEIHQGYVFINASEAKRALQPIPGYEILSVP